MNKRLNVIFAVRCVFLVAIFVFVNNSEMLRSRATVLAQNHDASDQQVTGPYDVVKDWPKPMATLFPEEKGWTWGSTQAIFAQNPNRIFISMRGELPIIKGGDPLNTEVPGIGDNGRGIMADRSHARRAESQCLDRTYRESGRAACEARRPGGQGLSLAASGLRRGWRGKSCQRLVEMGQDVQARAQDFDQSV